MTIWYWVVVDSKGLSTLNSPLQPRPQHKVPTVQYNRYNTELQGIPYAAWLLPELLLLLLLLIYYSSYKQQYTDFLTALLLNCMQQRMLHKTKQNSTKRSEKTHKKHQEQYL